MSDITAKNPLVWIDCEMTGLDTDIDELIEVAVIITDENLVPVDEGICVVIKPSSKAFNNMNDFVVNMHTASGLIHELDEGMDIDKAQTVILDYIKSHVYEKGKALIAGNSVGTDKVFLAKQMPELIDYLHYRIVDVSSIKELAKRWFPRVFFNKPEKSGNHRALGDIQDSIVELRYYRDILFPKGDGPTSAECAEAGNISF